MVELLRKAFWVLRHRPHHFLQQTRGYLLFKTTRYLSRLFWSPERGVFLGANVRVQRLRCLGAERPGARIRVGNDGIIYEKARLNAYGQGEIIIGAQSILGDVRIESRAQVQLGDRVITAWNVFIQDFDPHPVDPGLRAQQVTRMCESFRPRYRPGRPLPEWNWDFPAAPIRIGDDVWLGANVTILKGARIGRGCTVATGSVVLAGEYPDGSLLAGNPAKVIR